MHLAEGKSCKCHCSGSHAATVDMDAVRWPKLAPPVCETFEPCFQRVRAKSRNEICPELFVGAFSKADDVVYFVAGYGNDLAMDFLGVNGVVRRDKVRVFVCVRVILGLKNSCLFILSLSFHYSTGYTVGRWERKRTVSLWGCWMSLGYVEFFAIGIEPRQGSHRNLALSF